MKVEDIKMIKVYGGASSVTSTFFNHLSTVFKTVYSIGQDVGGAIRRIATNNTCPI